MNDLLPKTRNKILVVDDHPLFRFGLVELISELDTVSTVDQAGDGDEALLKIRENNYDLVLLDIELPRKNGATTVAEIRKMEKPPKIIMVTMHAERDKIQQFFGKGVSGYILKNTSVKELSLAMNLIMDGEEYYS